MYSSVSFDLSVGLGNVEEDKENAEHLQCVEKAKAIMLLIQESQMTPLSAICKSKWIFFLVIITFRVKPEDFFFTN